VSFTWQKDDFTVERETWRYCRNTAAKKNLNAGKKFRKKDPSYHSPLPGPSPLLPEESWVLPAAAEAKLEGSGEGIMLTAYKWPRGRKKNGGAGESNMPAAASDEGGEEDKFAATV